MPQVSGTERQKAEVSELADVLLMDVLDIGLGTLAIFLSVNRSTLKSIVVHFLCEIVLSSAHRLLPVPHSLGKRGGGF